MAAWLRMNVEHPATEQANPLTIQEFNRYSDAV